MTGILIETLAGFIGTIAFSLLFGVPRRYFIYCGLTGAAGWFIYACLTDFDISSSTIAILIATLAVALISRTLSVKLQCPSTVFLTTGIFPLVPGAGIFWTAYYLVINDMPRAAEYGFAAVKSAVAIVLGIVLIVQLPKAIFNISGNSAKKGRES